MTREYVMKQSRSLLFGEVELMETFEFLRYTATSRKVASLRRSGINGNLSVNSPHSSALFSRFSSEKWN